MTVQGTRTLILAPMGSSPGMTVQGAHAYFSAYGVKPGDDGGGSDTGLK